MLFKGHSTYTVGTGNLDLFSPSLSTNKPYDNVQRINRLQKFYIVIYLHENHSSVLCKVWNTTNVNEPKLEWNSVTQIL